MDVIGPDRLTVYRHDEEGRLHIYPDGGAHAHLDFPGWTRVEYVRATDHQGAAATRDKEQG